nr:hypothetical protein [Micromonospora sp. DSM 115978]
MAVDREIRTPGSSPGRPATDVNAPAASDPAEVSRATVFWYSAVGLVLLSWFLFGWLILEQGFIDSVGESLGTAFALLLAVSIVGTVRRSRRD